MHSKIGEVVRVGRSDMLQTSKGEAGCVVFGPYFLLAPGKYEVKFQIIPDSYKGPLPCCTIDVLSAGETLVEKMALVPSDLRQHEGWVSLPFEVREPETYEFRVFSTGRVGLKVNYDRPIRLTSILAESDKDLVHGRGFEMPEIYKVHHAFFKDLSTKGFSFRVNDEVLIAQYNNISFTIENNDDLQLIGEIFLLNEYNVLTSATFVAIDIGMNVGLTSLYLAAKENIRRVFSFEPFLGPFMRGMRNFALNPALNAKIEGAQFGLAKEDASVSVLASTGSTIGVSIHGASHGTTEQIRLRNAADVLRPIIQEAHSAGEKVLLKIDCEGSEFDIFETLVDTGLMEKVDAIVCEWHKWWSVGRNQSELFRPLFDLGFIVIDRTVESDPHAGLFYAIKNGR